MKTYIGTKIIKAQVMSAEDATVKLGRKLTLDNAKAEIATVGDGVMEYHPGYLVEYHDGYKSWSPKEQFEEAYHLMTGNTDSLGDLLAECYQILGGQEGADVKLLDGLCKAMNDCQKRSEA